MQPADGALAPITMIIYVSQSSWPRAVATLAPIKSGFRLVASSSGPNAEGYEYGSDSASSTSNLPMHRWPNPVTYQVVPRPASDQLPPMALLTRPRLESFAISKSTTFVSVGTPSTNEGAWSNF